MPNELKFGPIGNKEGRNARRSHSGRGSVRESRQGQSFADSGQATYGADEAPPAAVGLLLLDPSGAVVAATAVVRRMLGYPEALQRKFVRELRNAVGKLLDPDAPLEQWSVIQLVLHGRRCPCWGTAVELAHGERLLAVLVRQGLSTPPVFASSGHELSPREREMVVLLANGFTNKEIAARMEVSVNTVKAFLRSVMLKVGATTRAGVVGRVARIAPKWANPCEE